MTAAEPAPFSVPVTVRYSEVDAQGVVFNMWYLGWFDEAFTAFLAARGLPYREMLADGYDVQVVHAELDYRAGVRWQDDVRVHVRGEGTGRTSFTVGFAVHRGGAPGPAVTGRTVYVAVATDGSGAVPLPAPLRAAVAPLPVRPDPAADPG